MTAYGGTGARLRLADAGREWGWLAGMGLLVGDLLLPVPATAVISALGYLYGGTLGGIMGAGGSLLSGSIAYELCRRGGRRTADRLLGEKDRVRAGRLFAGETGGWLVALSRWLPLLPEMTACMAGLTAMPRRRFYAALASGCVPMGLVFAFIGASGTDRPSLALALSAAVPAMLYGAAAFWLKRREAAMKSAAE